MRIIKSVSFKNLVLFINVNSTVRTITELIRNVSLVRKIRLENVVRVGFDVMEKVNVGSVEQVGDDRHVIAAVTEPFAAAQQRVCLLYTSPSPRD